MPDKKPTEELLNELLDAPNIDGYIKEHDFAAPSLSDYLKQLLQEKGLERSRVVRMADLNETFGYQIFRLFGGFCGRDSGIGPAQRAKTTIWN